MWPDPAATDAAPCRLDVALRLSRQEVASPSPPFELAVAFALMAEADCRFRRRWCLRPVEAEEEAEDGAGADVDGVASGDWRKGWANRGLP